MVVCTHGMSDHTAGLRLFAHATVMAHRLHHLAVHPQAGRNTAETVDPDITFSDELTLRWGRHRLRLFHNPGKTNDTLNIDAPTADLAFASDNLVGRIVYLSHSSPELLDAALVKLAALQRQRVVGGHMGCFPGQAVAHARSYLQTLRKRVLALRAAVPSADQASGIQRIAIEDCVAPGVLPVAFEREWHGHNLKIIATHGTLIPT